MGKNVAKNNLIKFLTDDVNNPTENNNMLLIDSLIPYENHPFKLYEGDRLSDMVRSIKEMGILLPIIVRPIVDSEKYEILSGHNRVNAAKEAGLIEVPAIIKNDISDDEARLIVTETNLVQRSFADLSHSERAIALKSHMDAISKQGKRTDLINEIEMLSNPDKIEENETSALLVPKLAAREKIGEKYGLNRMSVTRYLRLSFLIKSLIERVDNDEIGIYPAVSLSYLSNDEQDKLSQLLDESTYKVDMKKAESLRELSESKKLTYEKMEQILSGELNKNYKVKSSASFKLKEKIILKYFPEKKPEDIEIEIIKAIEFYRAYNKEQ